MNNRGQSLIMFVLIIPIAILILFMVYDISRMALLRQELNDISEIAIDYGVSIMNDEDAANKVETLILKNKNDIDNVNIRIEDNKIYVTLEDKLENRISLLNRTSIFKVKSSYVGYLDNGKKIIERDM